MKNDRFRQVILPAVLILMGGLVLMALTWLFYALLYNLLERRVFPNDPGAFPANTFRAVFAVALVILYLLLLRTRLPDLVKAILLCAPLAAVTITLGFTRYQQPLVAVIIMVLAGVICAILLKLAKKPWIYFYAAALTSIIAIVYDYPR